MDVGANSVKQLIVNTKETIKLGEEPRVDRSGRVDKWFKSPDFDSDMRRFESFFPCH